MNRRVVLGGMIAGSLLAVGALMVRLAAGGDDGAPPRAATADAASNTASGGPGPRPTHPPTARTGTESDGPSAQEAGMPVGFAGTEQGAVAAAMSYAAASQRWLYFTDDEIAAAVAVLATPQAAEQLTVEVTSEIALARGELARSPGRVWWLVRPMATRVEFATATTARVSVWTVTVLSAIEVAVPQAEWLTVSVDLAWLDGDWRVDGVRSTPGPTPMLSPKDEPWTSDRFDDGLDGFTRVDTGAEPS